MSSATLTSLDFGFGLGLEKSFNMFTRLIVVLSGVCWLNLVQAVRNVTVDDQDQSIVRVLTDDPTATSTFTFTGVATYFSSPLWPYTDNTLVSLDSGPSNIIYFVDHDSPFTQDSNGPATVAPHVIWGAFGLANTQHKLVSSVGEGQPYAVVDSLMYTVSDDPTTSNSSTTTSGSTMGPPSPTSSGSDPNSTPSNNSQSSSGGSTAVKTVIAVSTILGTAILFFTVFGIWCYTRRRRRAPHQYQPSLLRNTLVPRPTLLKQIPVVQ
ncbi:hypothetical protein FPV67DRAFT_1715996 [Lyophyllum atratum]|nr:hypothetical protein FPV67DRAFT_1715996 [Lyophyllum atratum]